MTEECESFIVGDKIIRTFVFPVSDIDKKEAQYCYWASNFVLI